MINVLIVEDSAFMRKALTDVLVNSKEFSALAVPNTQQAIAKMKEALPEVLLIDFDIPILDKDNIKSFQELIKETGVPSIVLVSPTTQGSQYTLDALGYGAVDFVIKPSNERIFTLDSIKKELIQKMLVAAKASLQSFKPKPVFKLPFLQKKFSITRKKIVVIASSTGGPQTLEAFLTQLPKNIPAPILIVQHMPPIFTKSLAERLDKLCEIEVREAKEGDEPLPGVALIAPGGFHMELKAINEADAGSITLNQEPPELGVRPNANRLFKSVASIYKENTVGVVLTGMGNDGTDGSGSIKKVGGTILSEAESSCIIYGMPKAVFEKGYVDAVVELDKMGVALLQLLEV